MGDLIMKAAPGPVHFTIDLARHVSSRRLTGLAAEVTFYAWLSLFPGLLLLAGTLGMLDLLLGRDVAAQSESALISFLARILPAQGGNLLENVESLFDHRRGGVITTGALIGIWTVSHAFAVLIDALDLAYGVEERRGWLIRRLIGLLLALASLAALAVMLITMVFGPLLGEGRHLAAIAGLGAFYSFAWDWLRWPLAFALLVAWATTVYHIGPNRRAPWLRDLPGGILAAALWLVASWGFGSYLRVAAATNWILGIVSGGLSLMIWLYLLSMVMLLGAGVNAILERRRPR